MPYPQLKTLLTIFLIFQAWIIINESSTWPEVSATDFPNFWHLQVQEVPKGADALHSNGWTKIPGAKVPQPQA
jgi:hypothetical protein